MFDRTDTNIGYAFDVMGLLSDDGSRLWIGAALVLDHDGLPSARATQGAAALGRGFHPIRVAYFQAGGGKDLQLRMRPDGGERWDDVSDRVFVDGMAGTR